MSSILTERLALIPLNLPLINAALTDRALFEDLLGGVHAPLAWPQPDFADIMPILAETLRLDPALDRWTRLIAHRAEGAVLGTIGAVGPPNDQGAVEIGYDILPHYQRHGYATEAGRAFVGWLFTQPGVRCVTAQCAATNAASAAVLRQLGLHCAHAQTDLRQWELWR